MRSFCKIGVLVLMLAMSSTAFAAQAGAGRDERPDDRLVITKLMIETRDPFVETRVTAIQDLGRQSNADLVREFEVFSKLKEIAESDKRFPRERIEALGAMAQLQKNGLGSPNIIDDLLKLIEIGKTSYNSKKGRTPVPVQIAALRLMVVLANAKNTDELLRTRTFDQLKNLWKDSDKPSYNTSSYLRAQMIEAISGFTQEKDTKGLLLDALKEKSKLIRLGALSGLQFWLEVHTNDKDKDIAEDVTKLLQFMFKKPEEVETRIQCIEVLDALAANGYEFSKGNSMLRKAVGSLMNEGTDIEARAAVRFLLRTAADDFDIVDVILEAAQNKGSVKRDFETLHEFSKALVEVMNRVAYDSESTQKSKAKAAAQKVIDHFFAILVQRDAPIVLKQSALFGLGTTPTEFDRTNIVDALIKFLEAVVNAEKAPRSLIDECETSLMALTGESAKRVKIVNPALRGTERFDTMAAENPESVMIEVPNVEAWKTWFENNKEWLAAGKNPLNREGM